MIKILKKILNRLFGNKWTCEHCGSIEYCFGRPYCKGCRHIERRDIKMFKVKR